MSAAPAVRRLLEGCFAAAVAAADPRAAVGAALARRAGALWIAGEALGPGQHLGLLAAGKAAAPMAAALEEAAGEALAFGLAVVPDGHRLPLRRVALREAGHPLPDARGVGAAREALALAAARPAPDLLAVLVSGGASALWACPLAGLSLADVVATTGALLASGAAIGELNAVRKHLCELAGGRLARAAAARRVVVLAISDVLGDRLDVIGSGPCAPDPSTFADALAVLAAHGLGGRVPPAVRTHLEAGARGEREETPKPGDPALERVRAAVVASNATALAAAGAAAERAGWRPLLVTRALRGEAREVGRRLGALAAALRRPERLCLLCGGETTVTVRGAGRGGRSQELALAAALALEGARGIGLLAAGTDGTDGPTDAAGAFVDGGSAGRGRARGADPQAALAANDAYGFFAREGGLLRTGPTRTNVMDLVLVGIEPAGEPYSLP